MIVYSKLRKKDEISFGNYNIIIYNKSTYNCIDELLKIITSVLCKAGIIKNESICYFDKILGRNSDEVTKILDIEEEIIFVRVEKFFRGFLDDKVELSRLMKVYKDKIFIFEADNCYRDGHLDKKIIDFVMWKMYIETVSDSDKIEYVKNILDENNIKYRSQDLTSFSKKEFWKVKNSTMNLVVNCKKLGLDKVNSALFKKIDISSESNKSSEKKVNKEKIVSARQELEELVGLKDIKKEVNKIIDYVKVNSKRGNMPSLHMCFNGNPGSR